MHDARKLPPSELSYDQPMIARLRHVSALFRTTFRSIQNVPGARQPYLLAFVSVIVASLAMLTVRDSLGILNVALIYLLICFVAAISAGAGPAVLAALVSFLIFDVLFIPPYHTFSVGR